MAWLRSVLFWLFLFIATPLLALILSPALLLGGERTAFATARFWARLMLGALKLLCGVGYRIEGREHMPSGAAIVAANHQSMWETIVFYAILPRTVIPFKRELARNPVYGLWGRYAGIPIDREGGPRALRALTDAAQAHLDAGRQLLIFPEGTRTPVGETQSFKPGVAAIYKATNAPCVPVAHNAGMHWLHPGPLKAPGDIVVRFLEPIEPGLDRKAFLALLETRILTARPDLEAGARADRLKAAAVNGERADEDFSNDETAPA
ncbi:MAG: lysophospholipid acyltransferase family protein [Pseudomonadota bacterium]